MAHDGRGPSMTGRVAHLPVTHGGRSRWSSKAGFLNRSRRLKLDSSTICKLYFLTPPKRSFPGGRGSGRRIDGFLKMYNLHKDTQSVYVPLELFGQSLCRASDQFRTSKIAKVRCAVALEWCQYRLEGIVFSMAKGDAQRVWFPEMLARLRSQWRETMSCAALMELRDSLDTMLHRIRRLQVVEECNTATRT